MLHKRPCRFCGHWFVEDARARGRQFACRRPECQAARRRDNQVDWQRRNPEYFVARRWQTASTEAPARTPPPLERVPWDVVQTQFKQQPHVILGLFARVLLLHVSKLVADSSPENRKRNWQSPPLPPAKPDIGGSPAPAPWGHGRAGPVRRPN